MRTRLFIVAAAVVILTAACAKRLPRPANTAPGMPNVTWVLMFGDRDDPDREFSCQSGPQAECVVPATRPNEEVFSDLHFYYHGTGSETRYVGTRNIGYLQVSGTYTAPIDVRVPKDESLTNQSVTGIVTSMPGTYTVTLSLMATMTGNPTTVPVQETIRITVR